MKLLRGVLYTVAALAILTLVYQLGAADAKRPDQEYVVDATPNMVLTNYGKIFLRKLEPITRPQEWREWESIDSEDPAVAIVEFRHEPYPHCEVITENGDIFEFKDDGSGVNKRSLGNVLGVFARSSGEPKVIKPEQEEEDDKLE